MHNDSQDSGVEAVLLEEVERLREENAHLRNMLHLSVAATYRALEPIGDTNQDDPSTGYRMN